MYLKRQQVPTNWPIVRKGTTYLVKEKGNLKKEVPLLVVLREMLNIVRTRKEAKWAINRQEILVNKKIAKDERLPVSLLDIITIVPSKENYKLTLSEKGRFVAEKIPEKESNEKVTRIESKKMLKGKVIQMNLLDGQNMLGDEKAETFDSVLIDFKTRKIVKIIPLKENAEVKIISGRHVGKIGKVKNVNKENGTIEIDNSDEKITIPIKNVIAIK